MANLTALKRFIGNLQGDQLFNTGVVGSTSQLQHQTNELRKSFAELQAQPDSKTAKDDLKATLLTAHAVSVITDNELRQCETWLEEK